MAGDDRQEQAWLRELKDTQGEALRRRYGAHGLGIGRKRVRGRPTDRLALIFYVSHKRSPTTGGAAAGDAAAGAASGPEAVPSTISFTPEGATTPVELLTDVREALPATFEGDPPRT